MLGKLQLATKQGGLPLGQKQPSCRLLRSATSSKKFPRIATGNLRSTKCNVYTTDDNPTSGTFGPRCRYAPSVGKSLPISTFAPAAALDCSQRRIMAEG